MLKIINPELFYIHKTVSPTDNSNYVHSIETLAGNKGQHKMITTIITSSKNIDVLPNINIKYDMNYKGFIKPTIIANDKNTYDANLILVAFPFNGTLCQIKKNKHFRILAYAQIKMDWGTFKIDDIWYSNIAYFLIEPSYELLRKKNPFRIGDSLSIEIKSAQWKETKNKGNVTGLVIYNVINDDKIKIWNEMTYLRCDQNPIIKIPDNEDLIHIYCPHQFIDEYLNRKRQRILTRNKFRNNNKKNHYFKNK